MELVVEENNNNIEENVEQITSPEPTTEQSATTGLHAVVTEIKFEKTKSKAEIIQQLVDTAVNENDACLLKFLFKHCWNKSFILNITNTSGNTYLHQTCNENHIETTKVLIENGIDINARNNEGYTGLHYAVENSNISLIFLLCEAGIDPFTESKNGKQAFELAKTAEVKDKLRKYSIKCSQIKLIKNVAAWKKIVAEEEERETLIQKKQKEFEENRRFSYQKSTTDTTDILRRADSGIISDADDINQEMAPYDKSVDELVSIMPSMSRMFSHENNGKQSRKETKSLSLPANRSYSAIVRRAHSGPNKSSSTRQNSKDENSSKGHHGLKVSTLYENIKRTPIVRRKKKMDRQQRMSMPELPIFGSPESYI